MGLKFKFIFLLVIKIGFICLRFIGCDLVLLINRLFVDVVFNNILKIGFGDWFVVLKIFSFLFWRIILFDLIFKVFVVFRLSFGDDVFFLIIWNWWGLEELVVIKLL